MSQKVRHLVPFFIPGQGETVNETLRSYSSTPTMAPMNIPIRKWDNAAGFFRDAVTVNIDCQPMQAPPTPTLAPSKKPPRTSPPPSSTRLLTPAGIRQHRLATAAAATATATATVVETAAVRVTTSSSSPQSTPPPSQLTSFSSPSGKERPFAGSTFETASPPPAHIPLPRFVKTKLHLSAASTPSPSPSKDVTVIPLAREQAAVDLKRILRI